MNQALALTVFVLNTAYTLEIYIIVIVIGLKFGGWYTISSGHAEPIWTHSTELWIFPW